MSFIASRMNLIKPSPTLSVAEKAAELKNKGLDVISLSTGEPDFDTPEYVKEAAVKALAAGKTKYTIVDGTNELKDAIIDKFQRDNGLHYERKQISVGSGAKQVLYNLFLATLNPGDEVIIPSPYWVSYTDIVALAEGKSIVVPCDICDNFKLSAMALENVISENTKWLVINSPNNPTGVVYNKHELLEIAEVLRRHPHVHVVSDDIYEHVIYDQNFYNIAQVAPDLYDRVFIVNGLSKSHAMTGWRIGYLAGNPDIIKAMAIVQSQSTSNPNSIAQAASVVALQGDQSFLLERTEIFNNRLNLLLNALQNVEGLSFIKPNGAFYLFISCEKLLQRKTKKGILITSDLDFAEYLLTDYLVAVVPGSAFGMPNYFRISYATSDKLLIRACERIRAACEELE